MEVTPSQTSLLPPAYFINLPAELLQTFAVFIPNLSSFEAFRAACSTTRNCASFDDWIKHTDEKNIVTALKMAMLQNRWASFNRICDNLEKSERIIDGAEVLEAFISTESAKFLIGVDFSDDPDFRIRPAAKDAFCERIGKIVQISNLSEPLRFSFSTFNPKVRDALIHEATRTDSLKLWSLIRPWLNLNEIIVYYLITDDKCPDYVKSFFIRNEFEELLKFIEVEKDYLALELLLIDCIKFDSSKLVDKILENPNFLVTFKAVPYSFLISLSTLKNPNPQIIDLIFKIPGVKKLPSNTIKKLFTNCRSYENEPMSFHLLKERIDLGSEELLFPSWKIKNARCLFPSIVNQNFWLRNSFLWSIPLNKDISIQDFNLANKWVEDPKLPTVTDQATQRTFWASNKNNIRVHCLLITTTLILFAITPLFQALAICYACQAIAFSQPYSASLQERCRIIGQTIGFVIVQPALFAGVTLGATIGIFLPYQGGKMIFATISFLTPKQDNLYTRLWYQIIPMVPLAEDENTKI
jgi:hypothetical protein